MVRIALPSWLTWFHSDRRSAWRKSLLCSPTRSISLRTRCRCTRTSRRRARFRCGPGVRSSHELYRFQDADICYRCTVVFWIAAVEPYCGIFYCFIRTLPFGINGRGLVLEATVEAFTNSCFFRTVLALAVFFIGVLCVTTAVVLSREVDSSYTLEHGVGYYISGICRAPG